MKYSELYPQSMSDGIGLISALGEIESIPWHVLSPEALRDVERAYYVRSNFKTVIESFILADTSARARLIAALYVQKWSKLWKDFMLEYDPLHAYIVEEVGERNKNTESSQTDTYGREVVVNETDTGTVENSGTENLNGSSGIYGFNSVSAVPSDTQTDATITTDKETRNLANSNTTVNSGQDTRANDDKENEKYSITKKGNIGYSTPQSLIREDIELWAESFFGIVFSDIDYFITIQVY